MDSSGTFAMKLLQTTKACVLSLAIMPLVGTALDFDHFPVDRADQRGRNGPDDRDLRGLADDPLAA